MMFGCRGVLCTPIKIGMLSKDVRSQSLQACDKYQIRWVYVGANTTPKNQYLIKGKYNLPL